MVIFESTLQNSLKETLIEFAVESLRFIISYWIWTQTTELTIYLSRRAQNPSRYAGTLSLFSSQVEEGYDTLYIGADILHLTIFCSCFRSESNLRVPAWNLRKPRQLLQFLPED